MSSPEEKSCACIEQRLIYIRNERAAVSKHLGTLREAKARGFIDLPAVREFRAEVRDLGKVLESSLADTEIKPKKGPVIGQIYSVDNPCHGSPRKYRLARYIQNRSVADCSEDNFSTDDIVFKYLDDSPPDVFQEAAAKGDKEYVGGWMLDKIFYPAWVAVKEAQKNPPMFRPIKGKRYLYQDVEVTFGGVILNEATKKFVVIYDDGRREAEPSWCFEDLKPLP